MLNYPKLTAVAAAIFFNDTKQLPTVSKILIVCSEQISGVAEILFGCSKQINVTLEAPTNYSERIPKNCVGRDETAYS